MEKYVSERVVGSVEKPENVPLVKAILTPEKIEDGIAYCDVTLKLTGQQKGSCPVE